MVEASKRDLIFVGSARADLRKFPKEIRAQIGVALFEAQLGGKHPHVKPLKGYGGAGVLEVVEQDDGNTYRAVYTVRLRHAVYCYTASRRSPRTASRQHGAISIRSTAASARLS